MKKPKLPSLTLPGAVVIAGLCIALAVIVTAQVPNAPITAEPTNEPPIADVSQLKAVAPVTASDHVRGNPNAKITMIEYSDLDCPFCDRFQGTLEQALAEYPDDVRWVYRHFPLSFHPGAYPEAVALECINKLSNGQQFWNALPALLQIPSSNSETLDKQPIIDVAKKLGVDEVQFKSCMDSNEFNSIIDADLANGTATGGNGTPWTIIIGPDGQYQSVNGAQPYTVVKSIIDDMLK